MDSDRIYLTGFMGSGKSTVGRRVARLLRCRFFDLDDLIETEAGIPVKEIFTRKGESAFRALESECLRSTAGINKAVIALGGGAVVTEENLRFVLEHGTLVYLRVVIPELIARLRRSSVVRPLLLGPDGTRLPDEVLFDKIDGMLAQREPFYLRAHVVVDTAGCEVEESARLVVDALRYYRAYEDR